MEESEKKESQGELWLLVLVNGHLLLLALHFMACACQLLSVVAIFALALATPPPGGSCLSLNTGQQRVERPFAIWLVIVSMCSTEGETKLLQMSCHYLKWSHNVQLLTNYSQCSASCLIRNKFQCQRVLKMRAISMQMTG